MKKGLKYLLLGLSLFIGIGLVACDSKTDTATGTGTGTSGQSGTGDGAGTGDGSGGGSQTPPSKPTYKELDDCDFPVGKYMVGDIVYDYSKTDMKVVATSYTSYTAYKNDNGTKVFEATVKFVEKLNKPAVYFTDGEYEYFFLVENGKAKIYKKKNAESSGGLISVDNMVEPTYGTYVSPMFDHYKLGADGERVVKDGGGYEKENFYIFLELTATSAKIYASDNNTSHGETPLYTLDNYELLAINGYICIKIPHPNGQYSCSLRIISDTVIHCTNSSENVKGGDYSMSGNLTRVQ